MQCYLLGRLAVVFYGTALPLGNPRHQKVLARLALDANRSVPVSTIAAAVWDDPPASAHRIVRNAVSDLRIGWARAGVVEPDRIIVTERSGYALRIEPAALDTARFLELTHQAEAAAARRDGTGACHLLRRALSLWQGPLLGGMPGRVFTAAATRWDEERLAAWQRCTTLELSLGRHHAVVGELTELAAEHPYREEIVGHLMIALHRCGRAAEAMAKYHQLRERLAIDLGIDPDPRLQLLHTAILCRDSGAESTLQLGFDR